MLKKVLCFLVMIVLCGSVSFAEEDIYKDFYTVSNSRIISENDERVVISFDITNKTSNYYSELYFAPILKVNGEGTFENFYSPYYNFEITKFSLNPNEEKTITLNLKLPEKLPNKKYAISISLYTSTHRLDQLSKTFLLEEKDGENGFLENSLGEAYWYLSNRTYVKANTGPNVSIDDMPLAYLKLKSNFDTEKTFYPHYVVYERSDIYNPTPIFDKYGEEGVKFWPGEVSALVIEVPKFSKPESYLLKLNFVDENGVAISNLFDYRYVIIGEGAKINSIDLDNNIIKTYIYGPADRTELNVKFDISVYDENNILIKQEQQNITIGGEQDCFTTNIGSTSSKKITVEAKVSSNGNVLASKREEIEVEKNNGSKMLSDIVGTKYENAVKVLNGLGIINGYPDNTFKPGNQITRAEYSTIVTKLLNMDVSEDQDVIFSDVENHWAKPYINRIYKEGLVSGYPDGSFGPQNNVTYAEAVTILVNALEYRNEVNSTGISWPYNYINKALELNLFNNLDMVEYMTPANRGDISILTLNTYLLNN